MEEFIPDNLNVENVPLSSIKPYKNNPKIHNNKQVQKFSYNILSLFCKLHFEHNN